MTLCVCNKHSSFGYPGCSPQCCSQCILPGMVDLVHKKCEIKGCRIQCVFGYEGGKARRCSAHKLDGMKQIISCYKKCKSNHFTTFNKLGAESAMEPEYTFDNTPRYLTYTKPIIRKNMGLKVNKKGGKKAIRNVDKKVSSHACDRIVKAFLTKADEKKISHGGNTVRGDLLSQGFNRSNREYDIKVDVLGLMF